MIRLRNLDSKEHPHPNTGVLPFRAPTTDAAALLAALAENNAAWTPGTPVTLLLGGILPCSPWRILFTPSAAVTMVINVAGTNQFGESVSENVTIAAAAVVTQWAYKRLTRVYCVSRGASANTVSIGFSVAANAGGLGLPFRVRNAIAPGSAGSDFLAVLGPSSNTALASVTIQPKYHTLSFTSGVPTAGINFLVTDIKQVGNR